MAITSDTYTTYTMIGQREDLTDVITNIDPIDTWVTSNTGNGSAKARYHEWQTDVLAAAAANAQIEGDQLANTAIVPTVRTGNYCQILRKVFSLTDTGDTVDKAGRSSEISYQSQNKMKELAKDIEYALVINAAAASGTTAAARTMKGMLGWIATNTATGASTASAITEAELNTSLQAVWTAGGKPSVLLVGGIQKRAISAFTTNTRNVVAQQKTLVTAVDVYESDFGTLQVRLHRQINTTAAGTIVILGDMSLWSKAWLRKTKMEKSARVGPFTQVWVEAELTLESKQEKGSGKITGLKAA